MIGIQAMAMIADKTGHSGDVGKYTNIAHNYINKWEDLGVAHNANPPHATLSYGHNDTHGEFSSVL